MLGLSSARVVGENGIAMQIKRRTLLAGLLAVPAVAGVSLGRVAPARSADFTARELALRFRSADRAVPDDLSDHDFSYLDLSGLDFKRAVLAGADFYGTDLLGADLRGADLRDARLDRATIIQTNFTGANLSGVSMSLPTTFVDLAFNTSQVATFARADLSEARVLARLYGADFRGAVLVGADFSALSAGRATIASVPYNFLTGGNFDGADLRGANFSHAEMNFVSFRGADLRDANFAKSALVKADFASAKLDGAIFDGADLRDTVLARGAGLISPTTGGPVANVNRPSDQMR
ncbi:MAG: pentapeptide repeat-containing protein [Pseudomonadota bacterium]